MTKLTTTMVDSEWQQALKWRERFLDDERDHDLPMPALDPQMVCYLIADCMTMRQFHDEQEALASAPSAPQPTTCEGGIAVRWCPRCGTCTCSSVQVSDDWQTDPFCPIHGDRSTHAEPSSSSQGQERTALIEQLRGVEALALGLHIAASDRGQQRSLTLTELGEVVVVCGTAAVALEALSSSAPANIERRVEDVRLSTLAHDAANRCFEALPDSMKDGWVINVGERFAPHIIEAIRSGLSSSAPAETPRGPCIPMCRLATSTHVSDGVECCDLCGHPAEQPAAPAATPVLDFQRWAEERTKTRGPMTQDQYFLAQDAFFTAHPGKRTLLSSTMSGSPAETQEARPLPERHPRLNTERARLEQAFNEGSWSSVDNPSPEHDAAMRVVVDWLMGIGPEPVGPGHQLPDEAQPSPETPAKETR